MQRALWSIAVVGWVSACGGDKDEELPTDGTTEGDADTDADADTDTDADTDADTDPTSTTETGDTGAAPVVRTGPSVGSGVVLSPDNAIAVVANRTAGEIRVLDLDLSVFPATGSARITFDEGDAEPFVAVMDSTGDTAWVIERNAGVLLEVVDLRGSPAIARRIAVGSEPSGLAISPTGGTVYVSNWGEGTVTVVDAGSGATHAVDLNQALLDTGSLGPSVSGTRPGLARPYAIAVTNDGDTDDADETIYVTEFFGQDDPAAVFVDDSYFDTSKRGFVYHFDAATEATGAIALGASANMGFTDSNGATAGCFPNQLYSLALDGDRLYVTGTCASPRGPAAPGAVDKVSNVKTKVQTALYVVDTATGAEDVSERLHLNALWQGEYGADGTADDATRRYPLLANQLAFVPGTHIAYLTAYGADAVFRLEFDANGNVLQVGSGFNNFIDLAAAPHTGRLPYGIALTSVGNAVVVNENTRNLSIVDLGTQTVETQLSAASPIDPLDQDALDANTGRRFFVTGLGRWSLNGQGWNSCEGCHPHGLTDNVTWYFAAGPRQTTSLDASYSPDGSAHRVFNWTAIFDEVADFEGNTRGISGGVGAVVWEGTAPVINDDRIVIDGTAISGLQLATDSLQAGLNGSVFDVVNLGVPAHDVNNVPTTANSVLDDWNLIDAYVRDEIRSPNAPVTLDAAAVARGATLFTAHGCNGCHGGPSWTISERFYTPSQATNDAVAGTLGTTSYARGNLPIGLNPPTDATGSAFFRAGGSIQCVLRSVDTFPIQGTTGIAPLGVVVSERKEDMVSTAVGLNGYNPPSLLGASAGAPFLHAGNARTLEEVLDPTFLSHYRAFSANFSPSVGDVADLVAYLQSIDEATPSVATSVAAIDTILCE